MHSTKMHQTALPCVGIGSFTGFSIEWFEYFYPLGDGKYYEQWLLWWVGATNCYFLNKYFIFLFINILYNVLPKTQVYVFWYDQLMIFDITTGLNKNTNRLCFLAFSGFMYFWIQRCVGICYFNSNIQGQRIGTKIFDQILFGHF